jgi:hypothetical protein
VLFRRISVKREKPETRHDQTVPLTKMVAHDRLSSCVRYPREHSVIVLEQRSNLHTLAVIPWNPAELGKGTVFVLSFAIVSILNCYQKGRPFRKENKASLRFSNVCKIHKQITQ